MGGGTVGRVCGVPVVPGGAAGGSGPGGVSAAAVDGERGDNRVAQPGDGVEGARGLVCADCDDDGGLCRDEVPERNCGASGSEARGDCVYGGGAAGGGNRGWLGRADR